MESGDLPMTTPASSAPSRWGAIAILLAGSVGVPGFVALFKPEIAHSPKTAIPLLLGWELLVLLGGTFAKVWEKLESRWVDRFTDWVDYHLQAIFSRYRRHYLKWIFYRHRDFDVKGLTTQSTYNLELEQVFVDLTIEPRPPHATSTDPIRPLPKELTGRRQIWDYLTSKDFKNNLALIGAPGSGKTTLLKKIALQMTGPRRPKIRQKLPILLFLREHAGEISEDPALSLAEIVVLDLKRKQSQVQPPAAWFQRNLIAGRCLVLLDGLDEVASLDIRQKVAAWSESQISAFPENRFLISSRPHGYRTCPVHGVTVLEIQSFDREQVRQFVYNWYRANEIRASTKVDPGVEMNAREGAEDLLRRLGNSKTLTALAVNPLLLTMIANVHRFRSSLPGRRVELYSEICEVFLGKRQQARGIATALTPAQKQRVLQPLAYHLMCSKKRELDVSEAVAAISESLSRVAGERKENLGAEFLKDVENSSGLLLEREAGSYSFAHLAFQEYLAAVHIREQGLAPELSDKIIDPWWHEVIRLYGAQGDSTGILEACLANTQRIPALTLAVDILEEAREIEPELRTRVERLLKSGLEDTSYERFRIAAETLLTRRIANMVETDAGTFVDLNYISHAEYYLFLVEMRAKGAYYQPDHWPSYKFPAGQSTNPVVGVRQSSSQAFCDWLNSRDGAFAFRLPKPGELKAHRLHTTPESAEAEGFWTSSGLEKTAPPAVLPHFYTANLLKNDMARARALDRRNVEPTLAKALQVANEVATSLERILSGDIESEAATSSLGRGNNHRRNISLTIESAGALYNILDIDRIINIDRARSLGTLFVDFIVGAERFMDIDRAIALTLRHSLELNRDLALTSKKISGKLHEYLRWAPRILSLYVATLPKRHSLLERFFFPTNSQSFTDYREACLLTYETLVLLEARIDGIIPSVEGIRIVKERRT
jgi:predicted ATPase